MPFAKGFFDAETNTVRVRISNYWPGYSLPRDISKTILVFGTETPILQPQESVELIKPHLEDSVGNRIVSKDPIPVTYSVTGSSPIRLCQVTLVGSSLVTGVDLVEITANEETRVYCTVPNSGREVLVREGQLEITASVPGLEPVSMQVIVKDKRPSGLLVKVTPDSESSDKYWVTVCLLDNRNRLVEETFAQHHGYQGPVLNITAPDGTEIEAKSVMIPNPGSGPDYIMHEGVARFWFVPTMPGTYRIAATGLIPHDLWGEGQCKLEGETKFVVAEIGDQ